MLNAVEWGAWGRNPGAGDGAVQVFLFFVFFWVGVQEGMNLGEGLGLVGGKG